jgi:RNA polymerase sigma-B factor
LACSTPALQRRDALIRRFLPLADSLAAHHHRRWRHLLEQDDLIQVARLALVRSTGRVTEDTTAPSYLKRCITGALRHHLRDRALLVRLPASAQQVVPWRHLSLDAPIATTTGGSSACLLDLIPAPPTPATCAPSLLVPQLLALLTPRQAAAIQLTVLDGLSLRQAATALGISAMTVSRHRRQGLDRLHHAINAGTADAA